VENAYKGLQIFVTDESGQLQIKNILEYSGGFAKTITIDGKWEKIPKKTSSYIIKTQAELHPQQEEIETTMQLSQKPDKNITEFEKLTVVVRKNERRQKRNITFFSEDKLTIKVEPAWEIIPDVSWHYKITGVKKGGLKLPRVGTDNTITLHDKASAEFDYYKGWQIKIIEGAGLDQQRTILHYSGDTKIAIVDHPWSETLDATTGFRLITEDYILWSEFKDPFEESLNPKLSWEYWNKKGWVAFKESEHAFKDLTRNLLVSAILSFNLPEDIEMTDVSGQENYWIRARIVSGDFGKESYKIEEKDLTGEKELTIFPMKSSIRAAKIINLTIRYSLEENRFPEKCFTLNNLNYFDQTAACITDQKRFQPFLKLPDTEKSFYLGFDKNFISGPVKIFFAAKELEYNKKNKPKMHWAYRSEKKWKQLGVNDSTEAFTRPEILELKGARDFSPLRLYNDYLFWIRGTLNKGKYITLPELNGIFLNTVWALQAESFSEEILGSSDGSKNLAFHFTKFPILEGEHIRIAESLTLEEIEEIKETLGNTAIFEEKDDFGAVVKTWVLWQEAPNFFNSDEKSRRYTLDRAFGIIQFGDGNKGQIPAAGTDNIKCFFYQAGGGVQGNVEAGEITELKTAIGSADSVINPVCAGGGADTTTPDEMLEIGPARINHRNRAITKEDFEWLAKAASRKIARVRCLPGINNLRQRELGWVTMIIVPDSAETKPMPSLELRESVRRYLEARCINTLTFPEHIHISAPEYTAINISVDVYVDSIEIASEAEQTVRSQLAEYFHPLTGGFNKTGWNFGSKVTKSDIYTLLENITQINHSENLFIQPENNGILPIFKITKQSLQKLKSKGAPALCLRNLHKLLNNVFVGENDFLENVKEILSTCSYERYKSLIVSFSKTNDVDFVALKPNILVVSGAHTINTFIKNGEST